jgi:hypothetical protein
VLVECRADVVTGRRACADQIASRRKVQEIGQVRRAVQKRLLEKFFNKWKLVNPYNDFFTCWFILEWSIELAESEFNPF